MDRDENKYTEAITTSPKSKQIKEERSLPYKPKLNKSIKTQEFTVIAKQIDHEIKSIPCESSYQKYEIDKVSEITSIQVWSNGQSNISRQIQIKIYDANLGLQTLYKLTSSSAIMCIEFKHQPEKEKVIKYSPKLKSNSINRSSRSKVQGGSQSTGQRRKSQNRSTKIISASSILALINWRKRNKQEPKP